MIRKTAVLARVGLLPAAAALTLMGAFAARAESSPPADKQEPPAAAGAKPGEATAKPAKVEEPKASETAAKPGSAAEPKVTETTAKPGSETKPAETAAKSGPIAEPKPVDAAAKPGNVEEPKSADTTPKSGTGSQKATETAAKPAPVQEPKPATAAAKDDATAKATPEAAKKDDPVKGPEATAALPDASASPDSAGVADKILPPADAIVAGIREKLPEAVKGLNADDGSALVAYYDGLNGPAIWVSESGFTAKGKAVVAEIGKADDWGLPASDFKVPQLAAGTLTPAASADAEIELAKAVLKYARYARGGRINPANISQLMDVSPPLRAPKAVLAEIAATDAPDAYLRGLNPKHEQFERLRQALLKARGTDTTDAKEEEPAEDPALGVKLPPVASFVRVPTIRKWPFCASVSRYRRKTRPRKPSTTPSCRRPCASSSAATGCAPTPSSATTRAPS